MTVERRSVVDAPFLAATRAAASGYSRPSDHTIRNRLARRDDRSLEFAWRCTAHRRDRVPRDGVARSVSRAHGPYGARACQSRRS